MPARKTEKGVLESRTCGRTHVLAVRAREVYRAELIEQLGREIRRAIEAAGPDACFVLDLSGVEFLTSAAVGLVTNLRAHLAARGYPFALAGAAGEVARVIETTRLGEVMPIFPTVEETLREFRCR